MKVECTSKASSLGLEARTTQSRDRSLMSRESDNNDVKVLMTMQVLWGLRRNLEMEEQAEPGIRQIPTVCILIAIVIIH